MFIKHQKSGMFPYLKNDSSLSLFREKNEGLIAPENVCFFKWILDFRMKQNKTGRNPTTARYRANSNGGYV